VHEVLPVTEGFRLTLVYNLVRPGGRQPGPPDHRAEQDRAAALLRDWDPDGPVKLVLPLAACRSEITSYYRVPGPIMRCWVELGRFLAVERAG